MIGIIFDNNMWMIYILKLFAASGPCFRSRAFATRASRTTRAADSALNVRFAWHIVSKQLEKHDCWDTRIANANNFSLVAPSSNPTRNSSARSSSVPLSLWPCRCQLRTSKEAVRIPGPAFIARYLGRNCTSRITTCEGVKSNVWSMYFEVWLLTNSCFEIYRFFAFFPPSAPRQHNAVVWEPLGHPSFLDAKLWLHQKAITWSKLGYVGMISHSGN